MKTQWKLAHKAARKIEQGIKVSITPEQVLMVLTAGYLRSTEDPLVVRGRDREEYLAIQDQY